MILTNCRLVPELSGGIGTSAGTVEIADGKITTVSDEITDLNAMDLNETWSSGNDEVFDCRGMTLMPGLIDLHTHIVILGGVGLDKVHDKMGLLVAAAKHATQYLDNGFTTIRDCGSTFRVANYVRDMVSNGSLEAPDIISCGMAIMPTEVEPDLPMARHLAAADGEDEVRKAVRTEIASGADFVKIFASGAAADPHGTPSQSIMTEQEVRMAVETAVRKGRYVAAHCHSDDAVRICAESGVRTIEHATLMSDETLDLVLGNDKVILVPTLAVMNVGEGPRREYWLKRLGPMFDHCTKVIGRAYREGKTLGFGTDCAAGSAEYDSGTEFRFRRENCGMKDIDILLQATKTNAEIAGLSDRIGEVRTGLKADLILVDGRPDEDISAMYRRPEAVIKNGTIVRGTIPHYKYNN